MGALDDLTKAGLSFSGSPAQTEIALGDARVSVRVEESVGRAVLTAVASGAAGRAAGDLSGAALGAEGDTSFRAEGDAVIGTRTLVEPGPGSAYDAVFELAKATVSLVRLFGDIAELAGAGQLPTQEAAVTAAMPVAQAAQPFGQVAQPAAQVAPVPVPAAQPVWAPTHLVPAGGMRAWGEPHPSAAVVATLDAGLDLQVAETRGDWARVVASNGWTGWVDGRRLGPR